MYDQPENHRKDPRGTGGTEKTDGTWYLLVWLERGVCVVNKNKYKIKKIIIQFYYNPKIKI